MGLYGIGTAKAKYCPLWDAYFLPADHQVPKRMPLTGEPMVGA